MNTRLDAAARIPLVTSEAPLLLAAGGALTIRPGQAVAARNATGKLFGFDPPAASSTESAQEITAPARSAAGSTTAL